VRRPTVLGSTRETATKALGCIAKLVACLRWVDPLIWKDIQVPLLTNYAAYAQYKLVAISATSSNKEENTKAEIINRIGALNWLLR
jgi:hypothetical protein